MLLRGKTRQNRWAAAIGNKLKEKNDPNRAKPPVEPIVKVPYRKVDYDNDVTRLNKKIKKLKTEIKLLRERLEVESADPYFVNRHFVGVDNFSRNTDGLLDLTVEIFWTRRDPIIYVFGMQKCRFEFNEQNIVLQGPNITITGKLKIKNKKCIILLPSINQLSYPCVLTAQHLIS
jgi:hypothetical protein